MLGHLHAAYRRSGADLPRLDDPAADHGAALEGSFWRVVDEATGRVAIVLCGLCRPRDGRPWALVAVATHPGGAVRWVRRDGGGGRRDGFGVRVPGVLDADAERVEADLGDGTRVRLALRDAVRLRVPSLGAAQALPGLHQYWHAALVDGRADGEVAVGGQRWALSGARAYAEKNWGDAFADDWWWGQGFLEQDAAVSFAGGRLALGVVRLAPTAVVLRLGPRVHRLVAPLARVSTQVAPGEWRIRARTPAGLIVELAGDATPDHAHALPVPLVEARDVVLRSRQHLAGVLEVSVRSGGRVRLRARTSLAGLERGRPAPPPGAPPS